MQSREKSFNEIFAKTQVAVKKKPTTLDKDF